MNNNSKYDIIHDLQVKSKRIKYALENMRACIDVGKERKEQQDSTLIMCHPDENEFKLLAVADGMGGLKNGAKASNTTLFELIKWFESLPKDYYTSEKGIYFELNKKLNEIDMNLRTNCNGGGTTLAMAIISKYNTLLLNIGDTRIYIKKNSDFFQIGEDHSKSWMLYKRGIILNKDSIRYHKHNNLIYSRLGCENKKLMIGSHIISRGDYDDVFIFSDGVTDCMSDSSLSYVINHSCFDLVAENIIDCSIDNNSFCYNLDSNEYYNIINGGKDNASVALIRNI